MVEKLAAYHLIIDTVDCVRGCNECASGQPGTFTTVDRNVDRSNESSKRV